MAQTRICRSREDLRKFQSKKGNFIQKISGNNSSTKSTRKASRTRCTTSDTPCTNTSPASEESTPTSNTKSWKWTTSTGSTGSSPISTTSTPKTNYSPPMMPPRKVPTSLWWSTPKWRATSRDTEASATSTSSRMALSGKNYRTTPALNSGKLSPSPASLNKTDSHPTALSSLS